MRPMSLAPLGFAGLMAALGIVAVVSPSPASAAAAQLSDGQYVATARCAGLATGLGSDASSFEKVLRDQEVGRMPMVMDQASETRDNAAREAKRAGPDTRARFTAERDGACHAIAG